MPTPKLETELVNARATFNAAESTSGRNLQALGERYCALLDEYLDKLRRPQAATATSLSPYGVRLDRRGGQAAQLDVQGLTEWAEAEKARALNALEHGEKNAGKKRGAHTYPGHLTR